MSQGMIISTKENELLVLSKNRYYIIYGYGEDGDTVEFNVANALPMPSFLFALAALEDENLDDTLRYLQNKHALA